MKTVIGARVVHVLKRRREGATKMVETACGEWLPESRVSNWKVTGPADCQRCLRSKWKATMKAQG